MSPTATQALAVAIAGVAVGAIGVGLAWWAWIKVKRVRDAQRLLLGGGRRDLVDFAVSLQARIDDLHRAVDEVAAGLARVDRRVDGTVTNTSIVRYDAYEDTGGHQSASVAMLDSARTGVVVTAIQGRDYARIYMKELERGRASVALSPEEQEAVDRAMGR
ncbi:MAG TPA: DUF4446 family protein [Gaiellaceae bacterium]|jgi:hypothetical protein|nr:DUF4446 family protein [Gaiellaceae bacterium]